MLRKATINDVRAIHNLLLQYSQRGVLLGRSLSDLYDQIRDFFVLSAPDSRTITGTCSLHICWEDIAEIRSLAVRRSCQGQGAGKALVRACVEEAIRLGIRRLFVLTYAPAFFQKQGFRSVDKAVLPQKVWADCINCIKFPDCDEEAMMLDLADSAGNGPVVAVEPERQA